MVSGLTYIPDSLFCINALGSGLQRRLWLISLKFAFVHSPTISASYIFPFHQPNRDIFIVCNSDRRQRQTEAFSPTQRFQANH